MKIRKVKWANHPILGNLELDFVNYTTGKPFSTIVFAGENGSGKTTILETLNSFLCIGSFKPFDMIEYEVDNELYTLTPPMIPESNDTFFTRFDVKSNRAENIRSDKANNPSTIQSDKNDPRSYGCVFSRPRADYKTSKIESVKTNELDNDKYDSDKEDNFTSLKQLIVDIQEQDNEQYYDMNSQRSQRGEIAMTVSEFEPNSKIFRFKKAFNKFFGKVKYKKVGNIAGEKVILFEKNGIEISSDNLSTGEKQIVYRGAYLLRNLNQLSGATIMIDEPELSMHPKWQEKILRYYKDIFTSEKGEQVCQLFFATHSEHVLKSALMHQNDNLVIVLIDNAGIINVKRIDAPMVLPTITNAETNYIAFDIASNDYHIELYGWLQQKMSLISVKDCDNYIINHPLYDPAKHCKPSSNPHGTSYNSLCTFIRNAIDHPSSTSSFTEDELRTSIELLINILR